MRLFDPLLSTSFLPPTAFISQNMKAHCHAHCHPNAKRRASHCFVYMQAARNSLPTARRGNAFPWGSGPETVGSACDTTNRQHCPRHFHVSHPPATSDGRLSWRYIDECSFQSLPVLASLCWSQIFLGLSGLTTSNQSRVCLRAT